MFAFTLFALIVNSSRVLKDEKLTDVDCELVAEPKDGDY